MMHYLITIYHSFICNLDILVNTRGKSKPAIKPDLYVNNQKNNRNQDGRILFGFAVGLKFGESFII